MVVPGVGVVLKVILAQVIFSLATGAGSP
jgi:hypothetical protein